MNKKQLLILGSSGSIGEQCLDVVRKHAERFQVIGLAVRKNIDLLIRQVEEFKPRYVAVADLKAASRLNRKTFSSSMTLFTGEDSFSHIAQDCPADVAVIATVGAAGFQPTFSAIDSGKHIALANKEVLAMAGDLLMEKARARGIPVVPIDSEHSAILQCLHCGKREEIARLILTASGGPFRGKKPADFANVSIREALNHPTWNMGAKITIDCATLFNKGLEVIEAHHLFHLPLEQIDVIIHPQSIIHSMVEFIDGSVIAQLGDADMRTPIQYALSYPERIERTGRKLDLLEVASLTFSRPDLESFPCLALAYEAARTGGTMPAYLSVANEELVYSYLKEEIPFGALPVLLERSMRRHSVSPRYNLDDIQQVTLEARAITQEIIAHDSHDGS